MKDQTAKRRLRCAIYTRVSTDQGLEQDFNSLDAQREASEARSAGVTSTRSCRIRSTSAGSATRGKCTKANIRQSWVKTTGSKSSNACGHIWDPRGRREHAKRPRLRSQESSSTT